MEDELTRLTAVSSIQSIPPSLTYLGPVQLSEAEQKALSPPLAAGLEEGRQQLLYRFIIDPSSNNTLRSKQDNDDGEVDPAAAASSAGKTILPSSTETSAADGADIGLDRAHLF